MIEARVLKFELDSILYSRVSQTIVHVPVLVKKPSDTGTQPSSLEFRDFHIFLSVNNKSKTKFFGKKSLSVDTE